MKRAERKAARRAKRIEPSNVTPLRVVAHGEAAFPRPMKIHGEALAGAAMTPKRRAAMFAETFPVAHVPAWVPNHENVQIAMDDAIAPFYDYAGQFSFGYGETWPGFPVLAELLQRAEYRTIIETRAKEMTRKWIKLTYKGDKPDSDRVEGVERGLEAFKVRDLFRKVAEHDGAFGGSQIYLDTGATDRPQVLKTPLVVDEKTIPKGSLKGLIVVEPMWSYPGVYNSTDPLKADYFVPQTWYVNGKTVHHTRLITMVSAEMPDILKPNYSFRGLSMSQRAKPYIDNWLRTRQSVSDLLHSFSIIVLKTVLQAQLAGSSWNTVFDRVDVFNATRDNRGAMVIDKETEEMMNLAVPLGTLDALQAQSQEQMASVSQIPLVKLLGITPSGLNASSDGEIRVFYDNIHAMQEHLFGDPLRRIIDLIQLNEFGYIDPDLGFEFEPLWQLDEAGLALVQKTQADIDAIYVQEGVIANEEVRQRLADDDRSQYFGLDLDPDAVPDPPELADEPETSGDPARQAESRTEERSGV